ncbi:MAG: hypothetical protein IPL99_15315 [Candidatus Competibacteraceae bacterium]|nr:hypothetical protein [Candidatus Competibacteraceae bacterium]
MDRPIVSSGIRAAVIKQEDIPCLLLQRVARLRPTERMGARFMILLLQSRVFATYIAPIFTGISVPHLSPEQIKGFKVILPSYSEQKGIIEYIENETATLNTAISRLEREITLLREYRTCLVADVVTGKLDVREAAAGLPDESMPDAIEDDADLSNETESADEEAAE